jgi:hypothetical protein
MTCHALLGAKLSFAALLHAGYWLKVIEFLIAVPAK